MDHALAVFQLHISDSIENSNTGNPQNLEISKNLSVNYTFFEFIAPFILVAISVCCFSGQGGSSFVMDIMSLYFDTFENSFGVVMNDDSWKIFIKNLFTMTCRLNNWNTIEILMENKWSPDNFVDQVQDSIRHGHQKTLHVLLEALLQPDPDVKTTSGVVPKIFSQVDVLKSIPMIAKRFPQEVAWLLEELSYIPIPICVPKNIELEPAIKSKLISGLKLGHAALAETCTIDPAYPANYIWSRLNLTGQLKNINRNRGSFNYENDSVICMAPEVLVTQEAFHESVVESKYIRQTNSLIRLLATGEKSIILKPVTQALMEYHWLQLLNFRVHGSFWIRFVFQFTLVLLSIACTSNLFLLLAQRLTDPDIQPSIENVSYATIFLSLIFLIQELRQFIDDPADYYYSSTNMMDLFLHVTITYIAVYGGFLKGNIDVLLMALILVIYATRLLLHLRIMPSVGPLIRIAMLAGKHIAPILIPMSVMLIAFSCGFYILHLTLVPHTTWTSFSLAVQFTATFITFDYRFFIITLATSNYEFSPPCLF